MDREKELKALIKQAEKAWARAGKRCDLLQVYRLKAELQRLGGK